MPNRHKIYLPELSSAKGFHFYFQAVTQIDDVETCIACLESAGWDLQRSISSIMGDGGGTATAQPASSNPAAQELVFFYCVIFKKERVTSLSKKRTAAWRIGSVY